MFSSLQDSLYLGHFQAQEGKSIIPSHIQHGVEYIEVLTNGQVWFDTPETGRHLYSRGAIFWHVAGEHTIHDFPPGKAYGCYVVRFQVKKGAPRPVPHVTCPADRESLLSYLESMFRHCHEGHAPNAMAVYSVYSTLAYYALGPQAASAAHPSPLNAALAFLQKHACQTTDMKALAAAAHVSQDYLFALFRLHLGTTPHRYLLDLRISHAKQMLAGTDLSIKQVAAECGFNSTEVFYRQFQNLASTTPAQYRRRYQTP